MAAFRVPPAPGISPIVTCGRPKPIVAMALDDPPMAGEGKLETGTQRCAIDRGDNGLALVSSRRKHQRQAVPPAPAAGASPPRPRAVPRRPGSLPISRSTSRGSAPTQNCPSLPVITAPFDRVVASHPLDQRLELLDGAFVEDRKLALRRPERDHRDAVAVNRAAQSRSVMNGLSISVAGAVGIAFPDIVGDEHQVDVRIVAALARCPRPDHQKG